MVARMEGLEGGSGVGGDAVGAGVGVRGGVTSGVASAVAQAAAGGVSGTAVLLPNGVLGVSGAQASAQADAALPSEVEAEPAAAATVVATPSMDLLPAGLGTAYGECFFDLHDFLLLHAELFFSAIVF